MSRMAATTRCGRRVTPSSVPFRNTRAALRACSSLAARCEMGCTPSSRQVRARGASSSSVVTCVMSARFLTRPQLSPSGVSAGHSMPHWLGCSARGPDTLRVFSNCDVMRVIMPMAAMNDRRDSTCVTPLRSMRKRLMIQLPEDSALSSPYVMVSVRMHLATSNCVALLALDSTASACRLRSLFRRLNRSSNSSDISPPASSSRLLP
mmetsp:Transcript_30988/g.79051  ORF Transcript_30988/g.79051 Transcript_30988/m.79051 type:complete len:207 (-) Transcript_30988:1260-1880(-)